MLKTIAEGTIAILALVVILFPTINGVDGSSELRAALDRNALGLELRMNEQPVRAIDALRAAARLGPDVAEIHSNLSTVYFDYRTVAMETLDVTLAELYAEILNESRTAHELQPGDLEFARMYATLLSYSEDFGVAINSETLKDAWTRYLDLTDKTYRDSPLYANGRIRVSILCTLAGLEGDSGHVEAAREYLEEALDIVPGNARALTLLESLA